MDIGKEWIFGSCNSIEPHSFICDYHLDGILPRVRRTLVPNIFSCTTDVERCNYVEMALFRGTEVQCFRFSGYNVCHIYNVSGGVESPLQR